MSWDENLDLIAKLDQIDGSERFIFTLLGYDYLRPVVGWRDMILQPLKQVYDGCYQLHLSLLLVHPAIHEHWSTTQPLDYLQLCIWNHTSAGAVLDSHPLVARLPSWRWYSRMEVCRVPTLVGSLQTNKQTPFEPRTHMYSKFSWQPWTSDSIVCTSWLWSVLHQFESCRRTSSGRKRSDRACIGRLTIGYWTYILRGDIVESQSWNRFSVSSETFSLLVWWSLAGPSHWRQSSGFR